MRSKQNQMTKNGNLCVRFSLLSILIAQEHENILRILTPFRFRVYLLTKNQPILREQCTRRITMMKNYNVAAMSNSKLIRHSIVTVRRPVPVPFPVL